VNRGINKQELLKNFQTPDDKLLFSKVLDRLFLCQKERRRTFTDFCDPARGAKCLKILQGVVSGDIREKILFYGGAASCERGIIGFAPEEIDLCAADFPISRILIECRRNALSHRDFLGAILGLGVDRGKTGDIFPGGESAIVFAHEDIADFICANLEKVGRVAVSAHIQAEEPGWEEFLLNSGAPEQLIVSSLRLDNVISAAFHLSRSKSAALIQGDKASVNGSAADAPRLVRENDLISVRGFGRIKLLSAPRQTKKEKWILHVEIFQ
jgi:RNA-binding protein YlmH